jgi:hypothetical protein
VADHQPLTEKDCPKCGHDEACRVVCPMPEESRRKGVMQKALKCPGGCGCGPECHCAGPSMFGWFHEGSVNGASATSARRPWASVAISRKGARANGASIRILGPSFWRSATMSSAQVAALQIETPCAEE